MTTNLENNLDLMDDFIELTSSKVIRMAAYPIEEWIENGGSKKDGLLNSYSAVQMQDGSPIVKSFEGLLSSNCDSDTEQDAVKRRNNIMAHWAKVISHDYYINLVENVEGIKRANVVFQKLKARAGASDLMKSEFSDFHFYNLIAKHIGFYLIFDEVGYKYKYPDRKLLNQAKNRTKNLLDSIRKGLSLANVLQQSQLETLLKQLLLEIERAPRKDRETSTAQKRRVLEAFSLDYLECLEGTLPTILGHLAEAIGWNGYSHKTMEVIAQKATRKLKKSQNKKLADLLYSPS